MNYFQKIIFYAIGFFILIGLIFPPESILAQEKIELWFFYSQTCPHCHQAKKFLNSLKEKYPDLDIISYEVSQNRANAQFLAQLYQVYRPDQADKIWVPSIFIGDDLIIGFSNAQTTGIDIERAVQRCLEAGCSSPKEKLSKKSFCQTKKPHLIRCPFFGEVDINQFSLPVLTLILGGLDGFNPCAMWVLLFLLALLLNTRSRKKMFWIGGLFILTSAVFYYLLLAAWLNLFRLITYVRLTQIIIGVLAFGFGFWQIKEFIVQRKSPQPLTCSVTKQHSNLSQFLLDKIRTVTQSVSWPVVIFGTIILAVGINLIEFFCSAGLPAIYTQVLALNKLSPLSYYLYLLLYTIVFMADDLIVFCLALITFKKIGLSTRYNYYSSLIGGLVILILGLLLIFKPNWLVF